MADNKPAPPDRKIAYIAPLVIAVVIAGIFAVSLLHRPSPPPQQQPVVKAAPPKPVTPAPPAVTAPPPPLTRADIIDGVNRASLQYAATGKLASGKDSLVGRRFSLRIPFGCNGAQIAGAQAALTFDAANQSVTLSARPGNWTTLPIIQALPGIADIESVEGFWLPRPWSDSEACPPNIDYPVPVTPTPPTAQTLGLAQIFAANSSRVGQHADHPYEFTRKIPAGDSSLMSHSYELVLEGRITGFADGQALHCWAESPNHQPICLYAVSFDHVAFEDGDTGEVLANWNDERAQN